MRICILNPNSSEEMTEVIQRNARAFAADEFEVDCIRNIGAPEFIGCYEDIFQCTAGMVEVVKRRQECYDAFIVACHSDPALDLLKEISSKPVVGICEASVKLATMLGHRFSIISTGQRPIPEKEALCRKYGVGPFLASVVGPQEFSSSWKEAEGFLSAGKKAIDRDHAEVLVLGCAGMGHITKRMESELGVPVLDGVVCALIVASGFVRAGLAVSKKRRYCSREG